MSIDVLAWLEAFAETLPESREDANRLRQIRGAVKELIEAAQPFATFNCSDPTMTIATVGIPRLRAALRGVQR